jgi:glycine dehydrogenase subunit 1
MLKTIGVPSVDGLFSHIPAGLKFKGLPPLEPGKSEQEVWKALSDMAERNCVPSLSRTFLGGGACSHYHPAVVDALIQRAEFFTSYTPYQPEVSQGNLQAIFEYQTMVCQLTGLDLANASLYEGATALVEAILMASRALPGRKEILLGRSLHPHYRQVVTAYLQNFDFKIMEVPFTRSGQMDLEWLATNATERTLCVAAGYPNYFGVVEPLLELSALLKPTGALPISVTMEALALALLKSPGQLGAEIACGEAMSFGLPLSYGGPYLGFLATREAHLRRMPGRIIGETVDSEGKRGFVLTLSTREQHIRREKATSNICSNEALCALSACIYMSLLGRKGLRELAMVNHKRAGFLKEKLTATKNAKSTFGGPVFNEFALTIPKAKQLEQAGFVFGPALEKDYPELKDAHLFTVTEINEPADLHAMVRTLEAI